MFSDTSIYKTIYIAAYKRIVEIECAHAVEYISRS